MACTAYITSLATMHILVAVRTDTVFRGGLYSSVT